VELGGKRILVVGLGKTGEAVARFLLERGGLIKVSEKRPAEDLGRTVRKWTEQGVTLETGGHRMRSFLEADLIVPSPGVPPFLAELQAARERHIPVLSEIELAFRFLKGTVAGITGSCGKSTTATLAHKILREAGQPAFLAGNIGTPLISFVARSRPHHIYVTEISSFQLYYIREFRARVAAFLNISLNHMDWHSTFEDYYGTKTKIILGQRMGDTAVLNRDDPGVWALKAKAASDVLGFSRIRRVKHGACLEGDRIVLVGEKNMPLMPTRQILLPGAHNQENVMAAVLVSRALGAPLASLRNSVRTFRGLEHRLEKVAVVRGVTFINDSKATTVQAALKAVQSFSQKIVLILGGRDKGDDFAPLRGVLKKQARRVVLLGEARVKIRAALRGAVPLEEARTMKEAVRLGFRAASRGDVVLLAPACASFDMFRNFEDRGRVFKSDVRRLAQSLGSRS
jgi:UDP-N-acetylmuramoylalanine--D-glutamate ligase